MVQIKQGTNIATVLVTRKINKQKHRTNWSQAQVFLMYTDTEGTQNQHRSLRIYSQQQRRKDADKYDMQFISERRETELRDQEVAERVVMH